MIADFNFSILVHARLSAVLILCICRSRGNVSGSVPALSSSVTPLPPVVTLWVSGCAGMLRSEEMESW